MPGITASFAKQLADVVRWVHNERRARARQKRLRNQHGRGDRGILRLKLQENLLEGDSATARRTYQNPETGVWADGTDTLDDFEVYDAILDAGTKLDSGTIVFAYTDHISGLLNVFQSKACPTLQE